MKQHIVLLALAAMLMALPAQAQRKAAKPLPCPTTAASLPK